MSVVRDTTPVAYRPSSEANQRLCHQSLLAGADVAGKSIVAFDVQSARRKFTRRQRARPHE